MGYYKRLIRNFFSRSARDLRRKLRLSQEEMAERLHITSRAYSDLERGKYCLSATSLVFLLLLLDELNDQAVRDTLCALRRELCENEEDGLMEAEEAPPAPRGRQRRRRGHPVGNDHPEGEAGHGQRVRHPRGLHRAS